jgi:hypothetical protein
MPAPMTETSLINDVVNFLVPLLATSRQRQIELDSIFAGEPHPPDIDVEGPPGEANRHLVLQLRRFGTLQDGQDPLWVLLEQMRTHVGLNKQAVIASLQARLSAAAPQPPVPPPSPGQSSALPVSPSPQLMGQSPPPSDPTQKVRTIPLPPPRQAVINFLLICLIVILFLLWNFFSGRTEAVLATITALAILGAAARIFGVDKTLLSVIERFSKTNWLTGILVFIFVVEMIVLIGPEAYKNVSPSSVTQTPSLSAATASAAALPESATPAASLPLTLVRSQDQLTIRLPSSLADKNLSALQFLYKDVTGVDREVRLSDLFASDMLTQLNTLDCLRVMAQGTTVPSLIAQCEKARTRSSDTRPAIAFWENSFSISNGHDVVFICEGNTSSDCVGEYRP